MCLAQVCNTVSKWQSQGTNPVPFTQGPAPPTPKMIALSLLRDPFLPWYCSTDSNYSLLYPATILWQVLSYLVKREFIDLLMVKCIKLLCPFLNPLL